MKRIVTALALAGLLSPTLVAAGHPAGAPTPPPTAGAAAAQAAPPAPIVWMSSVIAAREAARAGQVVFVEVYTDWCGWCHYMDREVYASPAVASFATDHLFVRVNAEDGREGQSFSRAMGVRGYPALFVFSSDGTLLAQRTGAFKRPSDFLSWAARAAKKH